MKPTTKMFVHRLELMIDHARVGCQGLCPGQKGFKYDGCAYPVAGLANMYEWCDTCKEFMGVRGSSCPCGYYAMRQKDAIVEAFKRISAWMKANQSGPAAQPLAG